MTKVLVTGMTSRQCNPQKHRKDAMVSALIAEICKDLGYEVEHRNPSVVEDYADFDHVFLGLAPLHAMGSNRMYGAIAAYLHTAHRGACSVYLDDVDTTKIVSGLKTMHDDPARFTKKFFEYKLQYDIASQPEYRTWLLQGVEMLHKNAWPETLIPMFPWGDQAAAAARIPNVVESLAFDPSSFLNTYVDDAPADRKRQWVTETTEKVKWLGQQRVSFELTRLHKPHNKRPDDPQLVKKYAESWGVLDFGIETGWWYSRIPYAAQARALYVTEYRKVQPLGDAYMLLPDAAEYMDEGLRLEWADAQAQTFAALSEPRDSVRDKIQRVVEKK